MVKKKEEPKVKKEKKPSYIICPLSEYLPKEANPDNANLARAEIYKLGEVIDTIKVPDDELYIVRV